MMLLKLRKAFGVVAAGFVLSGSLKWRPDLSHRIIALTQLRDRMLKPRLNIRLCKGDPGILQTSLGIAGASYLQVLSSHSVGLTAGGKGSFLATANVSCMGPPPG